jgi:hypothetical protein
MKLSAVFESWHIGDGNYPPFHKGMMVNLAFQMEPTDLHLSNSKSSLFHLINFAEYDFRGKLLKYYPKDQTEHLYVIETDEFSFYIERTEPEKVYEGNIIEGKGTLLLDYYIWTEFLDSRPNPPNLFYKFKVVKILRIQMPEKFINRNDKGWAAPSRVPFSEIPADHIVEIDDMINGDFETEFYIIELESEDIGNNDLPKTFLV